MYKKKKSETKTPDLFIMQLKRYNWKQVFTYFLKILKFQAFIIGSIKACTFGSFMWAPVSSRGSTASNFFFGQEHFRSASLITIQAMPRTHAQVSHNGEHKHNLVERHNLFIIIHIYIQYYTL